MPDERDNRERRDDRDEDRPRYRRGRGGPGGPGGRGGGRRGRACPFCEQKVRDVDYKNPDSLRHFLTERGKIKPRRKNSTCAKHQRRLAVAIKRARHLALLPYVVETARGVSGS